MTAPLVPPDVDLRNFPYMPLDVLRLRDSDIVSKVSGEEFRCAVLLWCASWHQRPAASLPDDDSVLANLAGFGRSVKEWLRHKKGALHGWIKCDDGRLYHPTVAEKATEAWGSKNKQRDRTAAAREAKLSQQRQQALETAATEPKSPVTESVTENVTTSNRAEQSRAEPIGTEKATPSDTITPPASRRAEFDKIENECRNALGEIAPGDHVIGPVVRLIEQGLTIGNVVSILTSEARRKRAKPIRTWQMWATIIAEKHAEAPKLGNGHANGAATATGPTIDMGFPITESDLVKMIEKHREPAYARMIECDFGALEYFRKKVALRAPHLMKFWPPDLPASDPAKPALAVAK